MYKEIMKNILETSSAELTKEEIQDILEPRWKITTVNQNDDKYTMFYVDVVTGEVSQRFEYMFDM